MGHCSALPGVPVTRASARAVATWDLEPPSEDRRSEVLFFRSWCRDMLALLVRGPEPGGATLAPARIAGAARSVHSPRVGPSTPAPDAGGPTQAVGSADHDRRAPPRQPPVRGCQRRAPQRV